MLVILTGATGLVGSGVLHYILSLTPTTASTTSISRLSILSRKPDIPLLTHPRRPTENTFTKVDVVTHADFTTYPQTLLSNLKSSASESPSNPVAVIWALGMSQNDAKSAEQYIEVTKTYAVNAAKAFATTFAPQQVNFVYVSGEGATTKPGMFTPLFGRVKGETETELLALTKQSGYENLRVFNVRPAGVDPGAASGGQPAVNELYMERAKTSQGMAMRAGRGALTSLLRSGVMDSFHTPTEELGRFLVGLGTGDGRMLNGDGVENGWTVRNVGLRRLVKEM